MIPVGLATTLPVAALTGAAQPGLALSTGVFLVALAIASRLHWLLAIRRYASASS